MNISGSFGMSPEVYEAMQHTGDRNFYSFYDSPPEQKFSWHVIESCNHMTPTPMTRQEFEDWHFSTLSEIDKQRMLAKKQVGIVTSTARYQLDNLKIEYSTDKSPPDKKYLWHLGALRRNGYWSACGWAEQTREPITRAEYMDYCTKIADITKADKDAKLDKEKAYFAAINGRTIKSCELVGHHLYIKFVDDTGFEYYDNEDGYYSAQYDKDNKEIDSSQYILDGYDC